MRFKRYGWYEFQDTSRKRSALARKQQAARDALPLFADQVAEEQPGIDDVMTARRQRWYEQQQRDRDTRAREWREARRRLRAQPEPLRAALLAFWQRCRWPADPTYLLSMLHMHAHGRLQLDDEQSRLRASSKQTTTNGEGA